AAVLIRRQRRLGVLVMLLAWALATLVLVLDHQSARGSFLLFVALLFAGATWKHFRWWKPLSNKRLKLAGGDRFSGSGVLCPGGHELSFDYTAPTGGSPAAWARSVRRPHDDTENSTCSGPPSCSQLSQRP